ncbi:MAG: MBL fold metallo-hydrolase [Deltaproteobacteria bacterium]|nr:MBL fold metallo-hydrolase [Deltaproteobacteria bacterium]
MDPAMLELHFLASGSRGNATLLRWGSFRLLIDCGLSARELACRFETLGERIEDLDALCVTHEHSDHVTGLAGLLRRHAYQLPVHLTEPTAERLRIGRRARAALAPIAPGRPFQAGPLEIVPFRVSHDAAEPVGFRIRLPDGRALGLATDLGFPNPEAVEALAGCELIGLESNHDPDLLTAGPYPAFLKRRIRSRKGHLSNADAAGLLGRIASDRLQALFALHLSEINNRHKLARAALRQGLDGLGLSRVPVQVAGQHASTSFGRSARGQLCLL